MIVLDTKILKNSIISCERSKNWRTLEPHVRNQMARLEEVCLKIRHPGEDAEPRFRMVMSGKDPRYRDSEKGWKGWVALGRSENLSRIFKWLWKNVENIGQPILTYSDKVWPRLTSKWRACWDIIHHYSRNSLRMCICVPWFGIMCQHAPCQFQTGNRNWTTPCNAVHPAETRHIPTREIKSFMKSCLKPQLCAGCSKRKNTPLPWIAFMISALAKSERGQEFGNTKHWHVGLDLKIFKIFWNILKISKII